MKYRVPARGVPKTFHAWKMKADDIFPLSAKRGDSHAWRQAIPEGRKVCFWLHLHPASLPHSRSIKSPLTHTDINMVQRTLQTKYLGTLSTSQSPSRGFM